MAHETAVFPADDGVDRTDAPGHGRKFSAEGHDGLLVGNCYIDSAEIPVPEKFFHVFRLFFKQIVGIVAQMGMDLGGIAVSQLSSEKAAFH